MQCPFKLLAIILSSLIISLLASGQMCFFGKTRHAPATNSSSGSRKNAGHTEPVYLSGYSKRKTSHKSKRKGGRGPSRRPRHPMLHSEKSIQEGKGGSECTSLMDKMNRFCNDPKPQVQDERKKLDIAFMPQSIGNDALDDTILEDKIPSVTSQDSKTGSASSSVKPAPANPGNNELGELTDANWMYNRQEILYVLHDMLILACQGSTSLQSDSEVEQDPIDTLESMEVLEANPLFKCKPLRRNSLVSNMYTMPTNEERTAVQKVMEKKNKKKPQITNPLPFCQTMDLAQQFLLTDSTNDNTSNDAKTAHTARAKRPKQPKTKSFESPKTNGSLRTQKTSCVTLKQPPSQHTQRTRSLEQKHSQRTTRAPRSAKTPSVGTTKDNSQVTINSIRQSPHTATAQSSNTQMQSGDKKRRKRARHLDVRTMKTVSDELDIAKETTQEVAVDLVDAVGK